MNAKLQKILDDLRTAQISSEDAIRQAYSLGCKDAVKFFIVIPLLKTMILKKLKKKRIF